MKQWIGGASPVWPDRSWQIYALPRAAEVHAVAETYRPVLEGFAELAPVADEDLHMTVQPLPGWMDSYDGHRLNAVLAALRAAVADLAPVTVTVGPAVCGSAGVLLDVDAGDEHPLAELFRRARGAVAASAGDPPRSGWPGHVSLAYARGDRDSGEIQSPLRRVRSGPIRADWTLDRLHLVDVRQDPAEHTYTWRTALEIPLGTARETA